jgi:Protein of unknown function (DUF2637)
MTAPVARLRRVRWAVRAALLLGVTASVTANILHAQANPVAQAIAAWPPVALLLTVELISRVPVHRRGLATVRLLATATIAGIAAWVSYWHMAGVAVRYGESGASPFLLPLSVDGLVVVASISLVELAGHLSATVHPSSSEPARPAAAPEAVPDPALPPEAAAGLPPAPAPQPPPRRRPAPTPGTGPGEDGRVPAGTAAAVAYWIRRDPSLPAAVIAARIGRSERTVRRYCQRVRPAHEAASAST